MAKFDAKVYIQRSKYSDHTAAEFHQCCLSCLGCRDHKMAVGFSYSNGNLDIYPYEQGVLLEHPTGCPCRFLTPSDIESIPHYNKSRGVSVGVSLVLQSSDNYVLLTRRAKHMRTFPSVWVAPGGHLEPEETLEQGCLRELREETGLSFTEAELKFTTLGLWESVYPPLIAMGLPIRHHIVVYLLAKATEDYKTLQQRLKLQKDEVDAVTWLDQYIAAEVISSDDYGQSKKVPQRYFKALMDGNNGLQVVNLPLAILMSVLPPPGVPMDCERLSSGTKFALQQVLKLLYPTPNNPF